MAVDRKSGGGPRLAGLLEKPADTPEAEASGPVEAEPAEEPRGRGPAPKKVRAASSGKKIKGRTIYIDDALFERILVQAHRRDRTISEYVSAILERQVPDHRVIRADGAERE